MAANSELLMSGNADWLGGFPNLLKKENQRWWGTRSWLIQFLLWLVIINGVIFAIYQTPVEQLYGSESGDTNPADVEMLRMMQAIPELIGLIPYMRLAGMFLVIGVVVLAQSAIISEKQSGTAAWVLSKPVSRSAFVLSKVAGYGLGMIGVMGLLLGAVLYVQIWWMAGVRIPLLAFAGMIGLMLLNLFFYLTLTILLGTIFDARGAVVGIPFLVLFIYLMIPSIPSWIKEIMPWNLLDNLNHPSFALSVVQSQPLPSVIPLIATILWCLLFTGVALWRFNREEF